MAQKIIYSLLMYCAALSHKAMAQANDTLPRVKVSALLPPDVSKSTMPMQQLQKKDLQALGSTSVADAAKFFSGVLVKDYGGMGGLKTVSVRSLGANHTGVMYDGVMVGDAQAGQIDLGTFSLDNIDNMQLYVGNPTHQLLPARAYANAAVLAINTRAGRQHQPQLSIRSNAGSFGWWNASVAAQKPAGKHWQHNVFAQFQRADGSYPFKNYVSGGGNSKRQNADLQNFAAGYDAAYAFTDSNTISIKLQYNQWRRGLPGAVLLYNSYSAERLNNDLFFTQASWKKKLSNTQLLHLHIKYNNDYKYYIDPSYPNSAGKLENKFHQQEYYVSAAYRYAFSKQAWLALASDYFYNSLRRTDSFALNFAQPNRHNLLNNLSAGFQKNKWDATASLLHSYLKEDVAHGIVAKNYAALSPAFSVSYTANSGLMLRAFYKKIFRAPSFDDLYYTNIGNTALRPEYTHQYNIGLTLNRYFSKSALKNILLSTDVYYNKVKDRILAVPRQNIFQWTMLNIGTVHIIGADVNAHVSIINEAHKKLSAKFAYTYQDAKDKTDKASAGYNKQLPYTPRHSGAIALKASLHQFSLAYNVLLSSYRYRLGEQTSDNLVKEWATQDVLLTYNLSSGKGTQYRFTAGFQNIFNTQYQIIKYYPMPGFQYHLGVNMLINQ